MSKISVKHFLEKRLYRQIDSEIKYRVYIQVVFKRKSYKVKSNLSEPYLSEIEFKKKYIDFFKYEIIEIIEIVKHLDRLNAFNENNLHFSKSVEYYSQTMEDIMAKEYNYLLEFALKNYFKEFYTCIEIEYLEPVEFVKKFKNFFNDNILLYNTEKYNVLYVVYEKFNKFMSGQQGESLIDLANGKLINDFKKYLIRTKMNRENIEKTILLINELNYEITHRVVYKNIEELS